MKNLPSILLVILGLGLCVVAQDAKDNPFDASRVPESTTKLESYAQAGWKIEEIVKGDLNGDGKPDAAVKLAQIEKDREGGIGGSRVLVIAFAEGSNWKRAAFGDKILQCVDCGGAFFGVMPAPAGVTIEKGVLVIENEHGSRDVSKSTFRFRLIPGIGRFSLIGYDYTDNDRLTGEWTSESTNYSTMVRITQTGKGKRTTTKKSKITPTTIYLEDADGEELEGKALHRLGLD